MELSNQSFPRSRRRWLKAVTAGAMASGVFGASEIFACGSFTQGEQQHTGASADVSTRGTRVYNIRDFGAKGDGVTLDTAALQAAIDACNRDQGGTVLVPAGVFVIGTVEIKSNVTLHIAAQGKLLGSADGKQYHEANAIPLQGDSTLNDGNVGLIFAVKAENFTIEGPGTVDGLGAQFRSPERGVPRHPVAAEIAVRTTSSFINARMSRFVTSFLRKARITRFASSSRATSNCMEFVFTAA